jgi:hypothetical protein
MNNELERVPMEAAVAEFHVSAAIFLERLRKTLPLE